MNEYDEIRAQLVALKEELLLLRNTAKQDQKPVALDQQSVGRLSRMDSMQVQAMDQANDARRQLDIKRVEAALVRLDADEYGFCAKCGEEIANDRLAHDPAVPFCISCASS